MNRRMAAACLALLFSGSASAATAADLLTVDVGRLRRDKDFVTAIRVRIAHAHVVQVCHVPVGWDLKVGNAPEAGSNKARGAYITAETRLMHDALNGGDRQLPIAIIERDPGRLAVRVGGSVRLFVVDGENARRPLGANAFKRVVAAHCP